MKPIFTNLHLNTFCLRHHLSAFCFMAAILICAPGQAKTNAYDLKLDLSVKGKPLPSSKVTVKEGEQTSLTQSTSTDKTFVDVIAVEDSPGNSIIKVKFVMGTILPSGERKVLTSDEILANENQPAKVSLSTSKGEEDFSFVVTAKRKAQ